MAQEYFHRTPTSSGNRKIFTYAGWFKKNHADGSTRFDIILPLHSSTTRKFRNITLLYNFKRKYLNFSK